MVMNPSRPPTLPDDLPPILAFPRKGGEGSPLPPVRGRVREGGRRRARGVVGRTVLTFPAVLPTDSAKAIATGVSATGSRQAATPCR